MTETRVRMKRGTPNYDEGQVGVIGTRPLPQPAAGVVWVEFGVHRKWSHGESESTGCWCGPGEFEEIG